MAKKARTRRRAGLAKTRARVSALASPSEARPLAYKDPSAAIGEMQTEIGRNAVLLQDMYRAEMRAATAERELKTLRDKLVRLLSPDQIEAAKTCGVTPEFYALECIELYKEKFFPLMPAALRPLAVN